MTRQTEESTKLPPSEYWLNRVLIEKESKRHILTPWDIEFLEYINMKKFSSLAEGDLEILSAILNRKGLF